MSNREVAGLQALAKRHGGELSVNPDTGLPEAGFLDSLLPTIAGAGLAYFGVNPMMAAGIVGGISALDSKDLSKGLMAGLGAYGGAGLTAGLMGAGASQLGGAAAAQQTAAEQLANAGAGQGAYIPDDAIARAVTPSNFDKLSAGAGQLFSNPGQTLQAIGGGSQLAGAGILGAAAAPIIADEMVETTTEAPPQERGKIRPYTYSRQQIPQGYQDQQGSMGSRERRYFNDSYTAGDPYSAAGGGLVALAAGGYTNQSMFQPTTPLPENSMYGASRNAYDYLMGVNPTSGTGGGTGGGTDGIGTPPPTGTGKYVFDPVTRQYKWIPDPIKPVDVAAPVFENPVQRGGGDGYGSSPEGRAERAAYFDKMTPEQREAHAESLRTGVNFLGKVLNPLGFLDIFKGVPLPETTPEEDKAVQDLEARTIRDLDYNVVAYKSLPDRFAGYQPNTPVVGGVPTPTITTAPEGTVGSTPPQDPRQMQEAQQAQRDAVAASQPGPDRTTTTPTAGSSGSRDAAPAPAADRGHGREGQHAPSPTGSYGDAKSDIRGGGFNDARGGYLQHGRFDQRMAHGGIANLHQYNLGSYSDGGRLLKGPGDGVSDDIPATIGNGQPARLADGEFVIPARIVSELGNGSTDAGARALYKMMDRIQAGRRKTVGKDQVAKNSKSARHLPA
jgi:hypothetical protein